MKKVKKGYLNLYKRSGIPFKLRVLLASLATKNPIPTAAADSLQRKGYQTSLYGTTYCYKCGYYDAYFSVTDPKSGLKVVFSVGCMGIDWTDFKVTKA